MHLILAHSTANFQAMLSHESQQETTLEKNKRATMIKAHAKLEIAKFTSKTS
jgi:hypothetical protein